MNPKKTGPPFLESLAFCTYNLQTTTDFTVTAVCPHYSLFPLLGVFLRGALGRCTDNPGHPAAQGYGEQAPCNLTGD